MAIVSARISLTDDRTGFDLYDLENPMREKMVKSFDEYEAGSTGGGCVAYFRDIGTVRVLLTCSDSEERLPGPEDKIDLEFYDRETGECVSEDQEGRNCGLRLEEVADRIQSFLASREKA